MALSPQRYLTMDQAQAKLAAMGLTYTDRQMRRLASERKLPFFPDPVTGRLIISEEDLELSYRSRQLDARRELDDTRHRRHADDGAHQRPVRPTRSHRGVPDLTGSDDDLHSAPSAT